MATILKAQTIPVSKLRPAEWNANRVPKRILAKVRRSIEEFGFVENLVARPHPDEKGAYEVLSGNHRLGLLLELGVKDAPVVVVKVSNAKARLLAQTLNRTRGSDDPVAYRKLLTDVLGEMPVEQVAEFLPSSSRDLEVALGRIEPEVTEMPEIWGVVVECDSEREQVKLLKRLGEEGLKCRAFRSRSSTAGTSA